MRHDKETLIALARLEAICRETHNTEFRMGFGKDGWKLYIVKTRTLYTGELLEVLNCAIEDFVSYRTLSGLKVTHKNYKEYTYN